MAYLRALLTLLCLACQAPAHAGADLPSAAVLGSTFDTSFFAPGAPALPEARTPSPAYARGDFSQVPAFSFAYLNDLNNKLIDAASSSVDVAIFSITLKDNPEALLRAAGRGARVRLILDESHFYPKADPQVKLLAQAPGVELRTLRGTYKNGVNHNKIVICDRAAAATGSYNWTFGATFSNHENTFVARDYVRVSGFSAYFEWMWARSRTLSQGPSPELPEGHYGVPPQDSAPSVYLNGTAVPSYLFSPGSRSEERLAQVIDASSSSVDAVTFTFSSRILAEALVRAHRRGVKVRFLTDTNMGKVSYLAKYLFDSGVPMKWGIGRGGKGAMHDKFLVLDGKVLQTGSFNWTVNASRHSFENMVFTDDAEAVKAYQAAYDRLYGGAAAPAAGDFQAEPGLD